MHDGELSETPRRKLLNPRRSAHATIRGYLYQTCLGVLRWLDLQPNESLLCEGDEDLDRFLLNGESISEQVKAYTGSLGLSDRAVLESLESFLRSYVALRQRGDSRKFVFTTTAFYKKKRTKGLDFDLLDQWRQGIRAPEVIAAVRGLLAPQEDDKHEEQTTKSITWLDEQPVGWQDFMNAVEWSFDAPNLEEIRQKITARLALRADTRSILIESLANRLITHLLEASSQSELEDRILTTSTLSGLIEAAREDLERWMAKTSAKRLRAILEEVVSIEDLLHDNTKDLPRQPMPGHLLTAFYEVVPFDEEGRSGEIEHLDSWCQSDDQQSVLLLTGEGGFGKTRLMIEWCRRLRHQGWHAGFLKRNRSQDQLIPLLKGEAPRLVVVDYAEARLQIVESLLREMAESPDKGGPKIRLLLVARRAADWWDQLARSDSRVQDLLWNSPAPRSVRPLADSTEKRTKAFLVAAQEFSRQMAPSVTAAPPPPSLEDERFGRILYIHMAALAAVQGLRTESAEGLLREILDRERQFWLRQLEDQTADRSTAKFLQRALELAATALVLTGGFASRDQAEALLERALEPFHLHPQQIDTLIRLLHDLYGDSEEQNGHFLSPLQPDLLGEELVAVTLAQNQSLLGRVLDKGSLEERFSTLTVLTRLAQRRPDLTGWIRVALHGRMEALAEISLDVAVEAGDPMGLELAKELEASQDTPTIIRFRELSENPKYFRSVHLRELGKIAVEKEMKIYLEDRESWDDLQKFKYATLANNFGNWLNELGDYESALAATSEAADIYRILGQARPLAMSLTNLSVRLRAFGRHEEAVKAAEESATTYRELSQNDPEILPVLASCLSNLAVALGQVDRYEEALRTIKESIGILRKLIQDGRKTSTRALAISLGNLTTILGKLGREEDALNASRERITILRQLSTERPDAFLHSLAEGLIGHAISLQALGHREDALESSIEAVRITRQLAQRRPNAFLPKLALQLDNLGNMLYHIGNHQDALDATKEAVEIQRQLAAASPEVFLPELASSLSNLGIRYFSLDDFEHSLEASSEAVQIKRRLAANHSIASQDDLANSLNNLGTTLQSLKRYEEALDAFDESLKIYKSCEQAIPGAFLAKKAGSLANLGAALSDLGRNQDAFQVTSEAITIYRKLAEINPEVFLPHLATSLNNLGSILRETHQPERALQSYEESLRILCPFFMRFPAAFETPTAMAAKNYIEICEGVGGSLDMALLEPILAMFSFLEPMRSTE